jgi:hypothetical protein
MAKACLVGLCSVGFCYILVGMIGSAMYGQEVQTNFLLNLRIDDLNDVLFWGMNGGFLLSVFFSFPVMFFGGRNNFVALIYMFKNRNKGNKETKGKRDGFSDSIAEISSYIKNGTK